LVVTPSVHPAKLANIPSNRRATRLVAAARKVQTLQALGPDTPHLASVFVAGGSGADAPGKHTVSFDALPGAATAPPRKQCIDVDLAALIYTSGSTGRPKGVMLTHLNIVSAATSITTYLENTPDDIVLNVLPLSFDYGLYQVLMTL